MTSPIMIAPLQMDHSFAPGDDLAGIVTHELSSVVWPDGSSGITNGDIVVITSKVVAKAEGRVITAASREEVIDEHSVRVVATKHTPRGLTKIVQTEHGLVLAAAGLDASNTDSGTVVLLPADPDVTAAYIRAEIQARMQFTVGVLVTDTMGRPWRLGVTDVAIGASGIRVLDDFTGRKDEFGNTLEMTVVAIADEIAAAAELAGGKLSKTPLTVVRGLSQHVVDGDQRARDLVRPLDEDLFSLGTREALELGAKSAVARRRTIRHFSDHHVDPAAINSALTDALLAPAPHHTEPFRFIVLRNDDAAHVQRRTQLLDRMREAWITDLSNLDRKSPEEIERRVSRGDILRSAPVVVIPIVALDAGAHTYSDERRNAAERDMFLVAGGAAVENLMIRLASEGLGSAWISSTMFAPDIVREFFDLNSRAVPLGAVAIGHPNQPARERPSRSVHDYIIPVTRSSDS
jgi:coenzyme F420-0:L-glutamate ligase/coenzyme F420-1:gamma-L-glutamate ligase